MGEVPRIDVVRRQLGLTVELLAQCLAEIDDLHAIAYERHAAGDGTRVHVSVTDWSLDRHGDPQARQAYRRLVGASMAASDPIANACRDAQAILRQGTRPGRAGKRIASVAEVLAALEAQARRQARGDYTPVRVERQPKP